ncbi:hypothetical protein [Granulicella arctica]|uniref:hypothetical protein n=1 Tax=Granulicella arctica TaxID=940613 RepID=UPI0021E00733|nr:hypothetical protein [Granulicella arctica]
MSFATLISEIQESTSFSIVQILSPTDAAEQLEASLKPYEEKFKMSSKSFFPIYKTMLKDARTSHERFELTTWYFAIRELYAQLQCVVTKEAIPPHPIFAFNSEIDQRPANAGLYTVLTGATVCVDVRYSVC